MKLQDFIELIPEDKRQEYKTAIEKAVIINSREDVVNLRKTNPAFEAEFVNELRTKNETFMADFQKDKLPKLLDEEYKKRNPSKDPKDEEIESLKKQFAEMQRQAILKDRKNEALQKLSQAGIPAELADFVIDEDETLFNSKVDKLLSTTKGLIESKTKEALTGAVGQQKAPPKGEIQTTDLEAKYSAAMQAGDIATAIALKAQLSREV